MKKLENREAESQSLMQGRVEELALGGLNQSDLGNWVNEPVYPARKAANIKTMLEHARRQERRRISRIIRQYSIDHSKISTTVHPICAEILSLIRKP